MAQQAASTGRVALTAIVTTDRLLGHSVGAEMLRAVLEEMRLRVLRDGQVLRPEIHEFVTLLQVAVVCTGQFCAGNCLRVTHLVAVVARLPLAAVALLVNWRNVIAPVEAGLGATSAALSRRHDVRLLAAHRGASALPLVDVIEFPHVDNVVHVVVVRRLLLIRGSILRLVTHVAFRDLIRILDNHTRTLYTSLTWLIPVAQMIVKPRHG